MESERPQQVLTEHEVFDLVRDDLHCIEGVIGIESVATVDTAMTTSKGPQQNGKERLRAALLLLCARFAGGGSNMAIQFGAVVELLHAAALCHANVIAGEQARRHRSPDCVHWANCASVLAGDWLYLRAFQMALRESVLDRAIRVAQMMVMGEIIQINRIGAVGITEAECMELADRKTACLFSFCGELGALAAGADSQGEERLREFAWNLGMAFQLIDDTLDFVPSKSIQCKQPGGALKEGKVTLPLVYALEHATVSERDLVADVLRDRTCETVPFANVLTLVGRYGGIERTRARARHFTDRARKVVAMFPDSFSRRALFTLTDLVTECTC